MTEKEHIPSSDDFMQKIQRNEKWNPVYRRPLEELFKSSAFLSATNEILRQSDEMLKNVGMTDFTDDQAIKNALRAQGIAAGLTQAIELLCELASEPETALAEEIKDV